MRRRAMPVLLGLVLAGCAQTRWDNLSVDAVRAAADQQECDNVARIEAQQQVMFERLSGPRPVRGGVIGYPTGGGGFRERNSEWYWTQHFHDACMRSRGYRLVQVE